MIVRRMQLLSTISRAGGRGPSKLLLLVFAHLLSMGMVGCAALDQRTPEERVEQRALEQAQALVEQDYETALGYVASSFRDGPQAALYKAKFSGSAFWIRVEVRWVRCEEGPEPESCSVRVWIFNNMPMSNRGYSSARGSSVPISWDTTWIKVENEWYQYLD